MINLFSERKIVIIAKIFLLWCCAVQGNKIVYIIPNGAFGDPENCLGFCNTVKLVPGLQKIGFEVRIASYRDDLSKASFLICFRFPENENEKEVLRRLGRFRQYAIILEPPVGYPEAYDKTLHKLFKFVFTWHDGLVDGLLYKKIFYPAPFHEPMANLPAFENRKFCTMINSYRISLLPNELYSWRIKAIKFFNLEFYGFGWDNSQFPNYMGPVKSKLSTLKNYKFCICFENMSDQPGWISEKMQDCFTAGCIPIYWGATNIEKIIPENCYIDMRKFKNFEELSFYMNNFDEAQYLSMTENIKKFTKIPQAGWFSYDFFAYSILRAIVPERLSDVYDEATLASLQQLETLARSLRAE